MSNFHNIIKKICNKNNIECSFLSNDWVIMLQKKDNIEFITGYKFSLNNHALGKILDDKYAMYDVLRFNKLPVIEHNILYSNQNINDYAIGHNDYSTVEKFLHNNGKIILKPNTGTCGNDVYSINDSVELYNALNKLFNKYFSISYCHYYNILNEYRVIILDGEVRLVYKKVKPVVVGDGRRSIKELLIDFNYSYFCDKLNDSIYNRILSFDEVYEYNWKFNLSCGAKVSFDIDKNIYDRLINISQNVYNKIGIRFASVDIIESYDKLMILEINSGVMMENLYNIIDNKKIIEDIYEDAIIRMFQD